MPLIDPFSQQKADVASQQQQQSAGGKSLDEWMRQLMGKTLGSEMGVSSFNKAELPKASRVLKPDSMATMDFNPDRLNVHVDESDTVHNVTIG